MAQADQRKLYVCRIEPLRSPKSQGYLILLNREERAVKRSSFCENEESNRLEIAGTDPNALYQRRRSQGTGRMEYGKRSPLDLDRDAATDRSHKIDLSAFFTELFLLVLDPLSSPGRWLERIGKVLCLVGNLAIAKLHNADCLGWLLVIAEHVLGDP